MTRPSCGVCEHGGEVTESRSRRGSFLLLSNIALSSSSKNWKTGELERCVHLNILVWLMVTAEPSHFQVAFLS
jgi:hypothetical protein